MTTKADERRKSVKIDSELLDASHRMYPTEREAPHSDGPWTVIPSDRKPYNFAVIGNDKKPIAFTNLKETAESYAQQMNEKGFIEP